MRIGTWTSCTGPPDADDRPVDAFWSEGSLATAGQQLDRLVALQDSQATIVHHALHDIAFCY